VVKAEIGEKPSRRGSLGAVTITGCKTIDQTVQVPKLPAPVKRVVINYYYDVLAVEN
jgi:hypothetical protein